MIKWNTISRSLILCSLVLLIASCNKNITIAKDQVTSSIKQPYLLLISLDGFRWDYVDKYKPPHLSKFINNGVKAKSLVPSFPSKTFPNHYTIATGLYPDKHGLLGNIFYSHEKGKNYNIRDRETVGDGSYYKGTPIWVQAENSGMVSASYFFVGTEADVQGVRPTYYYDFDGSIKKEVRINQVIKWLTLPEIERPHLITMYFSDMDNTGHRYGPNNEEVIKKSLFELDKALGNLFKGIKETGLPVNIIIVSDHGMKEVSIDEYLPIERIKEDNLFLTINNGSIVNIHPKNPDQVDSIYHELKKKQDRFKVYKTEDAPFFEYVPKNKNWGTIQVIPDPNYYFIEQRIIGLKKKSGMGIFGHHGFDPELKDMHGIFYANGPAFQNGQTIPSFKNIHIYPLMCKVLGLDIPKDIDGEINVLNEILKK